MLIFINSNTDRQPTDTTSSFSCYFDNPIEISQHSKIGVKSVQLPYTCNQFKVSNSILWIATAEATVNEAYAVHIDYTKFYETVQDVVDELNRDVATIPELTNNIQFSIVGQNIAVKNIGTHSTYRVVSSNIFEKSFDGPTHSKGNTYNGLLFNEANQKLGFIGDLTQTSIPPTAVFVASGLPRIIRSNCFYIETNIIDYENAVGNPYKNPNIMYKVPTTSNFGSLICTKEDTPVYYKISDNSIDYIRISVLDEDLEPVDLNGAPLSITFEIV